MSTSTTEQVDVDGDLLAELQRQEPDKDADELVEDALRLYGETWNTEDILEEIKNSGGER